MTVDISDREARQRVAAARKLRLLVLDAVHAGDAGNVLSWPEAAECVDALGPLDAAWFACSYLSCGRYADTKEIAAAKAKIELWFLRNAHAA